MNEAGWYEVGCWKIKAPTLFYSIIWSRNQPHGKEAMYGPLLLYLLSLFSHFYHLSLSEKDECRDPPTVVVERNKPVARPLHPFSFSSGFYLLPFSPWHCWNEKEEYNALMLKRSHTLLVGTVITRCCEGERKIRIGPAVIWRYVETKGGRRRPRLLRVAE